MDPPEEFSMFPTFNVADLRKYYPPTQPDSIELRTIASEEGPSDVGPQSAESPLLLIKASRPISWGSTTMDAGIKGNKSGQFRTIFGI